MIKRSKYYYAICKEMEKLGKLKKTIFLGQQVKGDKGELDFYGTLKNVSLKKRIELPVCEELQMGMSIGLALEGYLPISIYQRMDFLPRCADQLINHLNLIEKLSFGLFKPKVIIRTTIGSTKPLNTGLQHSKDLTEGFSKLLDFPVIKVTTVKEVKDAYKLARNIDKPIMIIEVQDLYNE